MSRQAQLEVGNTPMVRVDGVYAKLECVNPTGSIKDRMVKFILDESEERGLLKKGMTIVEATGGNTGIALAYFGRQKGYEVRVIMPDNTTMERRELIRGFGAELILCQAKDGLVQSLWIRDNMVKQGNSFTTDQFSNSLNSECHYRTTGQEIISQLHAESILPDAFVAGVGTGGTLMGIAKALREVNPNIYIVAVEPAESAAMTGGEVGSHAIGGIGDGFVPALVRDEEGGLSPIIEEVMQVKSDDAIEGSRRLARDFGFCVGISSGANFVAAKRLRKRFEHVITVFPDGFTRYESLGLGPSGRCDFHGAACRTHKEIIASLRS